MESSILNNPIQATNGRSEFWFVGLLRANCAEKSARLPFSQFRRNRPPFFICPTADSMALRRCIAFLIAA